MRATSNCEENIIWHSQTENENIDVNHTDHAINGKEIGQVTNLPTKASPPSLEKEGFFSRISSAITWGLETCYFNIGLFVGEYPILTIIVCIVMCLLCGLGLKTFAPESDQKNLWVPSSARIVNEMNWVERVFPRDTRFVSIMVVEEDNVLTPKVMNALMDLYEDSLKITVGDGATYPDLCIKLGKFCYVTSLLELWYYDRQVINNLTTVDITREINNTKTMPISGVDVTTLLGGTISYGLDGVVQGAEATQITWVMKEDEGDPRPKSFESKMIQFAEKKHKDIHSTYVYATRSYTDETGGAIENDTLLLTSGFSIVFIFIMLSLGKFNLLEQKIYLSICGMVCVGLAVLVSYGIATFFSVVYSPIQAIMPFLLLGIGVDDMFVVVDAWKNLSPQEAELTLPYKMATTLSRAGVSITVTSVTDIVAFGIGASTVIPAMSSFCIYATMGIAALLMLVCTVFAGVLALDERRRRQRRDACICCFVHSNSYQPNQCSQGRPLLQTFFSKYYGPLLLHKPVKVVVILLTVTMACFGFWRFLKMERDFDFINYVPTDSYAYKFTRTKQEYFNKEGIPSTIFCGDFDYFRYAPNLNEMYHKLSQSKYIQPGTIVAWFVVFNQVMGQNYTDEAEYNNAVFTFVNSPVGSQFASFIKFNSTTEPVSIEASKFTLVHTLQKDTDGDLASMDSIRDLIDSCGLPSFSGDDMPTTKCFAFTLSYLSNETNKVLLRELYRNLALASAAVLFATILMVANLRTSFCVFLCVLFTLANVGGVLELWGVTIDTASSILLTLSVGLAVDYSAHVGHMFMTMQGNRNERAILTLSNIGPAVFNGGVSTFLAFVLLAKSSSYGFQLFFRVFMAVVLFGLFHGLTFLPVVLSIFGPPPYKSRRDLTEDVEQDKEDERKQPGKGDKASESLICTTTL